MMRRLLTGLLGATLLLGACGDDDDDGDRAAVTSIPDETTTSTTATTEPRTVAPDVIPQDVSQITEDYVEQVLNELYVVSLEAVVHTRDAGLVDETTIELVESISTAAQSRDAINGLINLSAESFDGFREDLRPATADVRKVHYAGRECVFAEVRFDNSGLVTEPPPMPEQVRGFVRLLPAAQAQRESSGRNPTAWVIDALPVTEDGTVPAEACPE